MLRDMRRLNIKTLYIHISYRLYKQESLNILTVVDSLHLNPLFVLLDIIKTMIQ